MTPSPDPPLLLLTRPQPQSEAFAAEARAVCAPHRVLIAPLTRVVPLPVEAGALQGATPIFTSANGVAAVAHLAPNAGAQAWCVGPATAAAARAAGYTVRQSGGDARHLLADLRAARPAGALVHVRGHHIACDLTRVLAEEGLKIRALVAYEARTCAWAEDVMPALRSADCAIAPLFSPRAAAEFSARLQGWVPAGLRIIAISPACAGQLPPELRSGAVIAERPDAPAMLRAVAVELSQAPSEP